ncbi:glycosyltransferase family 2 protein [uncultured Polaribacter sp.]|uniref:glycosyltransferase family 2 protein n=1 Tax=uncultured Polaribacter sp. TaxID=174711 RepID=UPI00263992CA|nr:glycosyltransferase family 2 protein [uncultured Polaribacter sp.]
MEIKFSIVITTKNRLKDLEYTLNTLEPYLQRNDVELLICDDASIDGTQSFLKQHYSRHRLIFNKKSKGLIENRNVLNSLSRGDYIISLDDDLNFLTEQSLEKIEKYFEFNRNVVLLSFRIFWNKTPPISINSSHLPHRVKSYAGGAHVIKKIFWNLIPNYPSWFKFYGEEDFVSYYALKHKKEIHYFPQVLTHHRVNLFSRKKHQDYRLRLRRSLRSGWYLYMLFYPLKKIPKLFFYTLWFQLKNKTFIGDLRATVAILQALVDLLVNLPRLLKNAHRLSEKEFEEYQKLPDTQLYWSPKNER